MDSTPLLAPSASNPESATFSRVPDSNDTLNQKVTRVVPVSYSSIDASNKSLQPTYYEEESKCTPIAVEAVLKRHADSRNSSLVLQVGVEVEHWVRLWGTKACLSKRIYPFFTNASVLYIG